MPSADELDAMVSNIAVSSLHWRVTCLMSMQGIKKKLGVTNLRFRTLC